MKIYDLSGALDKLIGHWSDLQGVSLKMSKSIGVLEVHDAFKTHDCARASTRNFWTFMFLPMVPAFDVQTASEEGTK